MIHISVLECALFVKSYQIVESSHFYLGVDAAARIQPFMEWSTQWLNCIPVWMSNEIISFDKSTMSD